MLKKLTTLAFLFPFFITSIHAQETHQMKTWFQYTNHDSLTISKSEFVQEKSVTTEIKITDLPHIQRIINMISSLPPQGDKMKSFSKTIAYWKLTFCNNAQKCDIIEFYGGRIKTPNTDFYADFIENEKLLSDEIKNLF